MEAAAAGSSSPSGSAGLAGERRSFPDGREGLVRNESRVGAGLDRRHFPEP